MKPITDGDAVIVPLIDRLLGRTVAQDIVDADGNVLVANGKQWTEMTSRRFQV